MQTAQTQIPQTFVAEDGTFHWTLSFYIPFSRLARRGGGTDADAVVPLPAAFRAQEVLTQLDTAINHETAQVRDAIEPLFNDIADRTRRGEVVDRLLVDGALETIAFHLPDQVGWKTEGRRFRVPVPPQDRVRPASVRRFWYLHSNGAMSWHIAFAVRYRAQLDRELAEGRVSTLYFLSLLQKLAWPKECDTTDIGALNADALLDVKLEAAGAPQTAPRAFWAQVGEWFAADRSRLEDVHDAAKGQPFAALLPVAPCIEVPGLKACETRSLFFVQDKQFFDLIQPKTDSGVRVPRRERILDEQFARYPAAIAALVPDQQKIHQLDRDFWTELLHAEDQSDPHGCDVLSPTERLLYLFLAGFNQNIIDWANQEASEVLDSLDPIYPSSEEQADERFFVRYANPRSLITYVPRSRTLEVGNDHILTCPYAFLIHVLAMNNEYLTREKESRALQVIDVVDAELERAGQLLADKEDAKPVLEDIEQQINGLRIDSFKHFDRHRYANPFRYDTERNVFDELEKLRGTSRLEFAHREALAALDEQAKDLERLRAESERKAERERADAERKAEREADAHEQSRDRALGALFGLIGLSGVGQLLFNVHEYFTGKGKPGEAYGWGDYILIALELIIMTLMLAGAWYFLLRPWRRRKTDGGRRANS